MNPGTSHILDRPVWNALTGPHATLAEGGTLARRYRPDIVPFAAARDDSAESLAALAALPRPGEMMALKEANELVLPPGFVATVAAPGFQMVLAEPPEPVNDARIEPLSMADAGEMMALATLTKPGPFTLGAQALGTFYGIRIDGRIAAMAGERLKPEGYAEVSGVCTHPDFRRRGLARVLSIFVTRRILARGETPFIQGWADNTPAFDLYESLGFRLRTTINVAVIKAAENAGA